MAGAWRSARSSGCSSRPTARPRRLGCLALRHRSGPGATCLPILSGRGISHSMEYRIFVQIPGVPLADEGSWERLIGWLERNHADLGPVISWDDSTTAASRLPLTPRMPPPSPRSHRAPFLALCTPPISERSTLALSRSNRRTPRSLWPRSHWAATALRCPACWTPPPASRIVSRRP
jgi:hypothetical protein